ncbi:MAG: hypothetical protein IBX56_06025 [Methylomicrobium sp.]|nr:hypothetical protein [Methylomicrobium sp.]
MTRLNHTRTDTASSSSFRHLSVAFADIRDAVEKLIELDSIRGQDKIQQIFDIKEKLSNFREFSQYSDIRHSKKHSEIIGIFENMCVTIENEIKKEEEQYLC